MLSAQAAILGLALLSARGDDPYLPPTPSHDAAGGCDGVVDGGFGFHTARELQPWWQVDLGAAQDIARVVVYNRCNTAAERAREISILTSSDGHEWTRRYASRLTGNVHEGWIGEPRQT